MARQDDNVTVLVIPTDFVSPEESLELIKIWLSVEFKGGRYQERLEDVDRMNEFTR
jgi:ribose 5-phosphate isomerase B